MTMKNHFPIHPPQNDILGKHPTGESFGCYAIATDGYTKYDVPHRELSIQEDQSIKMVGQLRNSLIKHHVNDNKISRIKLQLERLGFDYSKLPTNPFPQTEKTRKGNLAEVFLAEYITASTASDLPVYRLRFNPNIEQSMKGDDVLAFDFSKSPVRIIVGEAKFRATPNKKAVQDMLKSLLSSHHTGVPASLQFIADRLFEMGNTDLGQKVEDCAEGITNGNQDVRYIGLLMSSDNCKTYVSEHTEYLLTNLAVLSFNSNNINGFYESCFDQIEEEAFGSSK